MNAAPKRPIKLGSVQSVVSSKKLFSSNSHDFDEITLDNGDESDEINICKTCNKSMILWSKSRIESHTKDCALIKRLKLLEKSADFEKHSAIEKTSEKTVPLIKKWETSKDDVKFSKIVNDDESNRRRKRPRSFAIVELAPRECRCEVLSSLQSNFINKFYSKKFFETNNKKNLTEYNLQIDQLISKSNRLEQLSLDMRNVMEDRSNNEKEKLIIKCLDGEVECEKKIVRHRTTLMPKKTFELNMVDIEAKKDIVLLWITFVYTAQAEWCSYQANDLKILSMKYGPVGLSELIESQQKTHRGEFLHENVENPNRVIDETFDIERITNKEIQPKEDDILNDANNLFLNDDPLIGFGESGCSIGRTNERVYEAESGSEKTEQSASIEEPTRAEDLLVEDSFDSFVPETKKIDFLCSMEQARTPIKKNEKLLFASNVKVLKTQDITPMPMFETMEDQQLKELLKAIGQRPRGRKKMIEVLRNAYDMLHPVVQPDTPTFRPLHKIQEPSLEQKRTISERYLRMTSKEEGSSSKIFLEGKINADSEQNQLIPGVDDEQKHQDVPTKDLDSLKTTFLKWLRSEQNKELYNHVLALNAVSLEEVMLRIGKVDGPVSLIGKAKLVAILDALSISYQLPQVGGSRTFGTRFGKKIKNDPLKYF